MTDLYIKTPTQTDYDALMRLAEAAGYMWNGNEKPTQFNAWPRLEGGTVINLVGNKVYYEPLEYLSSENCAIETIPNLAGIKAIWHVTEVNHPDFVTVYPQAKHMLLVENGSVIQSDDGSFDYSDISKYKALAVEYKPKESEVMTEKVKLPKFMCDWLDETRLQSHADYPFNIISDAINALGSFNDWLWEMPDNQWKLIDALRNGYEPEPEQLYYVRMPGLTESYSYLVKRPGGDYVMGDSQGVAGYNPKLTMPEILAIDPRYKVFAVPVEEVDE